MKVNSKSEIELKRLIEQTIASFGDIDPALLPHRLREQLSQQVAGDHAGAYDIEALISASLKNRSKKS